MDIYKAVQSVPESAKKPITGGRLKGKTDINPMWRIKTLTEQFGPCGIGWYYTVTKQWLEPCGDEIAAFVNIELYICIDSVWSKPIPGHGGSMFAAKEKNGINISDECYKMATTDALSVACKMLGIGADVYWDKDKTKYDTSEQKNDTSEQKNDTSEQKNDTNDTPNDTIDVRLRPVWEELKRIGYNAGSVCRKYKIDDIRLMSDLQIKDFLQKVKEVPNKGA